MIKQLIGIVAVRKKRLHSKVVCSERLRKEARPRQLLPNSTEPCAKSKSLGVNRTKTELDTTGTHLLSFLGIIVAGEGAGDFAGSPPLLSPCVRRTIRLSATCRLNDSFYF